KLRIAKVKQTTTNGIDGSTSGMQPSDTDHAINAAVLAGSVAPEQARAELLAYLLKNKTQRGFIESRAWRRP
ncbi:MAG: hypothetical protein MZW92_29585, partial [Comamonadaceae bacterium]|nr:hypothetical protein [Comamonadaceae bacterium]